MRSPRRHSVVRRRHSVVRRRSPAHKRSPIRRRSPVHRRSPIRRHSHVRRHSMRRNGYGAVLSSMSPLDKCGAERLANKQLANRLQKEVNSLKVELTTISENARKLRSALDRCVGLASKKVATYYF